MARPAAKLFCLVDTVVNSSYPTRTSFRRRSVTADARVGHRPGWGRFGADVVSGLRDGATQAADDVVGPRVRLGSRVGLAVGQRRPTNGNHRRHLSSGGSSDDSSTDHDRDQPRNTSGLPVSFASNLNDAITGGGMVRVDSAKHIHEAMATIPGLHKRGKSLELPMTKRLAFEVPEPDEEAARAPVHGPGGVPAVLRGLQAARRERSRRDGSTQLWRTRRLTKIPRADPRGARTATRDAAQAGELHRQRAGARAGRSGAADAARRGARGVLGALRHRAHRRTQETSASRRRRRRPVSFGLGV